MREIKFRAWDEKSKKMYSAEEMGQDELTINPNGSGFVNVSSSSTKLSIYMKHLIPLQFTDLKDKNEKEIYEGDILSYKRKDNKNKIIETRFLIEFGWYDNEGARCYGYSIIDKIFLRAGKREKEFERNDKVDIDYYLKDLEVIGNIWENKELLKG